MQPVEQPPPYPSGLSNLAIASDYVNNTNNSPLHSYSSSIASVKSAQYSEPLNNYNKSLAHQQPESPHHVQYQQMKVPSMQLATGYQNMVSSQAVSTIYGYQKPTKHSTIALKNVLLFYIYFYCKFN